MLTIKLYIIICMYTILCNTFIVFEFIVYIHYLPGASCSMNDVIVSCCSPMCKSADRQPLEGASG